MSYGDNTINEEVKVNETIKEIPGFSRYLADIEKGRVYRKQTDKLKGKWLRQSANDIGYVMTTLLSDENRKERIYIHEIVMSAAIEQPKSFWATKNLQIDHRDRNKGNNNFFNLHLVTKIQNHKNIENRKNQVRLSNKDVTFIKEAFSKWEGRKIQFYKLMAKEFGCVWQTIQYTLLGYHNTRKIESGAS